MSGKRKFLENEGLAQHVKGKNPLKEIYEGGGAFALGMDRASHQGRVRKTYWEGGGGSICSGKKKHFNQIERKAHRQRTNADASRNF